LREESKQLKSQINAETGAKTLAEEENRNLQSELDSIKAESTNLKAQSEVLTKAIVQASMQKDADSQETVQLQKQAVIQESEIGQQETQIKELEKEVANMERDINGIKLLAAKYAYN
jgi:chromosome segregation ATPase